jgi:hypothetical protein
MRILISHDPLLNPTSFTTRILPGRGSGGRIRSIAGSTKSVVIAYRRRVTVKEPLKLRLHVSADQRYELFVDGERVSRGPKLPTITAPANGPSAVEAAPFSTTEWEKTYWSRASSS